MRHNPTHNHEARPAGGGSAIDGPRFVEDDPITPDSADRDDSTLIRGIDGIGYALATTDDHTGVWYVAAGGSLGNPIRTRTASAVRIWHHPESVRRWVQSLPALTLQRLAERRLTIVPIRLAIMFAGSFEQIHLMLRRVEDTTGDESGATAEYVLCYRPPSRRRTRRRSRSRRPEP
jgi:hypothetical protein